MSIDAPAAERSPATSDGSPPLRRRPSRLGNRLTPARAVPMVPAFLLLIGFMLGPIV